MHRAQYRAYLRHSFDRVDGFVDSNVRVFLKLRDRLDGLSQRIKE